jgi:hypothetical protein
VSDVDIDGLEGASIETARWMTDEDVAAEGWPRPGDAGPVALELSNGQVIYPAADAEWNGGGGPDRYTDRDGEMVPLYVVPHRERGE